MVWLRKNRHDVAAATGIRIDARRPADPESVSYVSVSTPRGGGAAAVGAVLATFGRAAPPRTCLLLAANTARV